MHVWCQKRQKFCGQVKDIRHLLQKMLERFWLEVDLKGCLPIVTYVHTHLRWIRTMGSISNVLGAKLLKNNSNRRKHQETHISHLWISYLTITLILLPLFFCDCHGCPMRVTMSGNFFLSSIPSTTLKIFRFLVDHTFVRGGLYFYP